MAGLVGAIFALLVGGIGIAVNAEGATSIVGLAWAAMGLSILGIIGGALAGAKAKTSGVLMLIAGIDGLIAVSMAYIIAAPLLMVGGIMAFFTGRPKPA